ncbi:hypothetical protein I551_9086 [Mycobacterium ulcerans str. Harvey]|uniref:Uncharacterized protein n=1 Tax=Mycobacterium ulcerans str. Harvey TaxID=1299332 RepID=A0ABN0R8Y3_MYCUL|nr:hypothetical protein I551_9086 [Mycobacterium ulcerans str. Harvey]
MTANRRLDLLNPQFPSSQAANQQRRSPGCTQVVARLCRAAVFLEITASVRQSDTSLIVAPKGQDALTNATACPRSVPARAATATLR